jgi:hypothetical protein
MSALWDIMGGLASGKTLLDEMCSHLKSCGMDARLLEKDSPEALPPSKVLGMNVNLPIGTIKVDGKNFELIELPPSGGGGAHRDSKKQSDLSITTSTDKIARGGGWRYIVRTDTSLNDQLDANLKHVEKGLFSKEIVDYNWGGGGLFAKESKLSVVLSSDLELKKMLLNNFTEAHISVNNHQGYVSIQGMNLVATRRRTSVKIKGFDPFAAIQAAKQLSQISKGDDGEIRSQIQESLPTKEELEVYDRVAYQVKALTKPSTN